MSLLRAAHISRDPGPLVLNGIHARTLQSLLRVLDDSAIGPAWVFADLSLGAWRSHLVASEFCAQLGLTSPLDVPPIMDMPVAQDTLPSYADITSVGIDVEAGGDRSTLNALKLASQVVMAVIQGSCRTFLVLIPRYGLSWENENVLFIRFLSQGLRRHGACLILINTDEESPPLPTNWIVNWLNSPDPIPPLNPKGLFGLVPGIVGLEVADAIRAVDQNGEGNLLPLSNGYMLVPPECRRRPQAVSRFEYDTLAVTTHSFGWLKAYAQFFGNNLYVDPWFLATEAWQRFAEGGPGIALRLLERALSCARTPTEQAILQSQAQGIRIALLRFDEAARAPDPSPAIPQALQGFLLEAKGWGLVMSNDSARSFPYLLRARELLEPNGHNREYLYLLNIYALNRLKSGDLDAALKIEKEIESIIAEQANQDWQLKYVNSINIARLYRRLGDLEMAECYYQEAFATTLGARSESDAIYTNVCLAQLNAQLGRPAGAFMHWLRASLHWVSCSVPEALGSRVATAILQRKSSLTDGVPEEISTALIAQLLPSAKTSDIRSVVAAVENPSSIASLSPVFTRLDQMSEQIDADEIYCATGMPGLSILLTRTPAIAPFAGENHLRLRSLLYKLLMSMGLVSEVINIESIVIDDQFGREIPQTFCELLDACIRLRIPKMMFGSAEVELNERVRAELEKASRIRVANAVDRIQLDRDSAFVTFKRYFVPKTLSEEESQILVLIEDQPTLEEIAERTRAEDSLNHVLRIVRPLEHSRIVNLYLPEDSDVLQRLVSSRF